MMGSGSDGRPVGLPTALCGSYTRSTRFDQGFNPVRTEAPKATPASMPVGMGRSPVSSRVAAHSGAMRLDAQNGPAQVQAAPDTVRPIRLRLGPLRFSMDTAEAIDLARQLVAAVDELKGT